MVTSCRQISAVAVVSGSHLQPTSDRNHTPHETATSGAEGQRGKGCMICRICRIAVLLLSLPQAFCCAPAPASVPCLDKTSYNASSVVVIQYQQLPCNSVHATQSWCLAGHVIPTADRTWADCSCNGYKCQTALLHLQVYVCCHGTQRHFRLCR